MSVEPLDILLLCNRTGRSVDARTVTDHLDAFGLYSRHRVQEFSFLRDLPSTLELDRFDAIVVHYTIAVGWLKDHYLSPESRRRLREYAGLKALFIQDEYHAVNDLHETLRYLRLDLLFTVVPTPEIEKVYPASALPDVTTINNLTGYVPKSLVDLETAPIAQRPVDVGYRTRQPPFWLGQLAYEKWEIADRFAAKAAGLGFVLDLSYVEGERLYGKAWTRFIARCKSVLGAESGSSVFDFDGSLRPAVDAYVAAHPRAGFREVQERFLLPYEGRIQYGQISPRCFEAAALRTAMVLYEGDYSGALQPWRHYIPLRKDFGNFEQVVDALRDTPRLQEMATRTFEEVACGDAFSYETFISVFDEAMASEFQRRDKPRAARRHTRGGYILQLARSPGYVAGRLYSRVFQWLLLGPSRRQVMMNLWYRIPSDSRESIRPLLRKLLGR